MAALVLRIPFEHARAVAFGGNGGGVCPGIPDLSGSEGAGVGEQGGRGHGTGALNKCHESNVALG